MEVRLAAGKLLGVGSETKPQPVPPRFPIKQFASESSGGTPLRVRNAVIPYLAALPDYANLSDEVVVEMARQKTRRRLRVQDRWVAIALLLGTRDVLPIHLR